MEKASQLQVRGLGLWREDADWKLRRASALHLARRELLAGLHSPSLYLMVTLACLVAAVLMKSFLDYVSNSGTLVMANPLRAPLLFAVIATTGYLGLVAAAGLAGERERGTLEVLFYGPVDAPTYIAGKMLGHLATYGVATVALAIFLWLASMLTGIPFDASALLLLAASALPAACMVALSLLLAALVGRMRPALALTALTMALFIAIDVGSEIAAAQPGDTLFGSAAALLSTLAGFTNWLSPFDYLLRAVDDFALGNAGNVLLDLGAALIYGVLLTGLAVAVLRWRGVQRWRE